MFQFPKDFISSVKEAPGFEAERFSVAHDRKAPTSLRLNPRKPLPEGHFQARLIRVPWCQTGYIIDPRPSFTFDPLFHAGAYYVQEASSMFLEQALKQHLPQTAAVRALDLCAAPGGKSTHIHALLPPGSLLVSNDVVSSRVRVLMDNINRWGGENVIITHNDPSSFGKLDGFFDLMVVDAPCSGSGLFRKDPDAMQEWSQQAVLMCQQRQMRILSEAINCLKPGGLLVYSTCSYSVEEDEFISDWLMNEHQLEYLPIAADAGWGVVESGKGYRFFPDKLEGEGFFLACFRAPGGGDHAALKPSKQKRSEHLQALAESWLEGEGWLIQEWDQQIVAYPAQHADAVAHLTKQLNLRQVGLTMGEIMKGRLVPHHALALSPRLQAGLPHWDLSREGAIRFLQRQDIGSLPGEKGWLQVRYQDHGLGWVNSLGNRVNNYYPKELRILKTTDDAGF